MRICFIVKRSEEVEDFFHWQVFVCQSNECFWWQTHLLFFIVLFFLNIKKKKMNSDNKSSPNCIIASLLYLFIFYKRRYLNYFNGYSLSFCVGEKDSSWAVPGNGEGTFELYPHYDTKNIIIWWLVDAKLHCLMDCTLSFKVI